MKKLMVILCLGATGVLGCASTASLRSVPLEAGAVREFSGEYTKVLRAARDAVVNAGLAIDTFDEINATTAVIVAKKGASAWSWGELVRVVVQENADGRTSVRVVTKRKLGTNVTAKGDYTDTIFSNITLALL